MSVNQNIVITGGAGFIGSHLVEHFLNHPSAPTVIVIDDFSTGTHTNLPTNNPRLVIRNFTIGHDTALDVENVVRDAHTVYHMAALVGVKNVVENCAKTISNNFGATEVVLNACKKYHKRIILASTSECYGKNTTELSEQDDIIFGSSYRNRWSYGVTKVLDEFLALDYYERFGLPVCILRFFNISGSGQQSAYGMVIPRFVKQALAHQAITVFKDGSQRRSFTHIQNVVEVISDIHYGRTAIEPWGKILNVGNPSEITIKNLAQLIISMVPNSKSELEYNCEGWVYGKHFEDMERRFPNVSALESVLGRRVNWLPVQEIVQSVLNSK